MKILYTPNGRPHKDRSREARGLAIADQLRGDIRYAVRGLRRNPVFSLAAVCSLALGIGANVAIFAVFDAALLRPFPYREPSRLVAVAENHTTLNNPRFDFAAANFFDLGSANRSFEDLAAYMPTGASFSGPVEAQQIGGGQVKGKG